MDASTSGSALAGTKVSAAACGIDLLPPKQRMDRFDEAAQIVRSLLTSDRINLEGAYYTLDNARCGPKGVQPARSPVIDGGGCRGDLRIATQHLDPMVRDMFPSTY